MRCLLTAILALLPLLSSGEAGIFPLLWGAASTPSNIESFDFIANDTSFNLSFSNAVDVSVEWGDGAVSNDINGSVTIQHAYTSSVYRTVRISGTAKRVFINDIYTYILTTLTPYGNIAGVSEMFSVSGNNKWYDCNSNFFENVQASPFYPNFSPQSGLTNFPSLDPIAENVVSLERCFSSCSGAKTFPEVNHCTNVASIHGAWDGCSGAQYFPEVSNLTKVTTFYGIFGGTWEYCTSAIELPSVANLTNVTSYRFGWRGCTSLTNVPQLVPSSSVLITVAEAFDGNNKMGGTVIELWNTNLFPSLTGYTNCFRGCTNLANYGDIPAGWK